MSEDILPDCRAKDTKNRIFSPMGAWVPVFCANCGDHGGNVPEENMNFAFYMCPKCFERLGHLTCTMVMPDEVFFEKIKQEQLASFGHYLTQEEIGAVVEANDTPLARLLTKG